MGCFFVLSKRKAVLVSAKKPQTQQGSRGGEQKPELYFAVKKKKKKNQFALIKNLLRDFQCVFFQIQGALEAGDSHWLV